MQTTSKIKVNKIFSYLSFRFTLNANWFEHSRSFELFNWVFSHRQTSTKILDINFLKPTETKYKNKFNSSSIYQQPKRKKPQNYSVELAVLNEGHSDRQSKLFKSASPSPQKPVVKSKFNQTHLYFQQRKNTSLS